MLLRERQWHDLHRMPNDLDRLHETHRNMAHLIYLDRSEGMHGFKALGKFIVFFSHQRLFWDQAGSDTIQFKAMTESLKILAARLQWDIEGMYIRLDILSIPQQNTSQKTLAVDSLNTYPVRPMLRS